MTWSISATQPRPTTLPSITNTSVSQAKCINKNSAYGKKYTSSKMRALSSQRAKRLTRLAGLVPVGTFAATLGNWVLFLATIPLISAARVVKCRAHRPWGSLGYACLRASRMARYWRRLSLIVCSFWIGHTFQRAYTMGQPLNYLFQNDLAKVSGREIIEFQQYHRGCPPTACRTAGT